LLAVKHTASHDERNLPSNDLSPRRRLATSNPSSHSTIIDDELSIAAIVMTAFVHQVCMPLLQHGVSSISSPPLSLSSFSRQDNPIYGTVELLHRVLLRALQLLVRFSSSFTTDKATTRMATIPSSQTRFDFEEWLQHVLDALVCMLLHHEDEDDEKMARLRTQGGDCLKWCIMVAPRAVQQIYCVHAGISNS
jgi:hypothetical protein